MKVIPIIILLFLTFSVSGQSDQQFDPLQKFSSDTIIKWTNELFDELEGGHPGMYRYTTKSSFDTSIKAMLDSVQDSLTTLEYYRKLKPLFAQIGCLHTSISLAKEADDYYNESLKFIPLEAFINDSKQVFVTKNYDLKNSIPLRSEIISINGKPITEILDMLYAAIPSDGYNETLKTLLLNYRFAIWYQRIISTNDKFYVMTKLNGKENSYQLSGISKNTFPTMESLTGGDKKVLSFEIEDSIGYLKVGSFGKTSIKKHKQKFDQFIKNTFKTLQKNNIQNLVIDLRNNTGGTDGNAAHLASYFFDEKFQYWKHPVEMTEGMAEQFKFWYGIFYKMPRKVDTTYQWKGTHWWLSREFTYYKVQKPAKYSFNGRTYIITNGGCMSSCADFVAILSSNNKATIVGQESGGGYQGNTSGMMPLTEIKGNLQMVTPLQKYTNAVNLHQNVGRGTIPDHIVSQTLDSWMIGTDLEMQRVKELIYSKK